MWVQWDDDKDEFKGVVRELPPSLRGRAAPALALLGYRELVVDRPEDYIARFPHLLGSSVFKKMADGRVKQTFPDADFSVKAVRAELVRQARESAGKEMTKTDWYVVRSAEGQGKIPKHVAALRAKIRAHVDWIADDVEHTSARLLVEYQWHWPRSADDVMLRGVPVQMTVTPPPPVDIVEVPPQDVPTGAGFDPDAVEEGNPDPNVVDPAPAAPAKPEAAPAPATTDGHVPFYMLGEEPPSLDAEGFPLITVYAPNVEDIGPRPDNE